MSNLDLHFLDALQRDMHQHFDFLQYIIDKYGEIKAVDVEIYDAEIHLHDFIFFCITKATRSAEAADVLLTSGFAEDAMAIARSIYECYLHIAFIQRNEERIDELLSNKIALDCQMLRLLRMATPCYATAFALVSLCSRRYVY